MLSISFRNCITFICCVIAIKCRDREAERDTTQQTQVGSSVNRINWAIGKNTDTETRAI